MNEAKSLVASKTFWGALFALAAIVSGTFHLSVYAAWFADPASVDTVMQWVGIAGTVFAMFGRMTATTQITSVLPPSTPPAVKSLAVVGLLFFCGSGLAGCAAFQQDWNVITSATISPTAVIVSANAFDGLESTATAYLSLPNCPTVTKVCRAPEAVPGIVKAVRAGRTARNSLEALLAANGNAAIPVASYNTLTAAVSSLQSLFTQYNVTAIAN